MGKAKSLTGQRFGKLVVIKDTGKRNNSKRIIYSCKCDCGNEFETTGFNLSRGDTKSCGCLKIEKSKQRYINLVGKKFGKYKVIAETHKRNPTMFLCECECGNKIEVRSASLINGTSKGCVKCSQITHGMSNSRIYKIWKDMKNRCKNPNNKFFNRYGGRGIKVCEEWLYCFENFYEWAINNGYTESLTIDRIDVDGMYEPSNCRWASVKEQNNNKASNFTYKGECKSLKKWCKDLNINYRTMMSRKHILGLSTERALGLEDE
jgi:hypothetical protein